MHVDSDKSGTAKDTYVKTYKYPGLWMSDDELDRLRQEIRDFTKKCLSEVPTYGVFDSSREPYKNRILSCVYTKKNNELVGFSALVLWSYYSAILRKQLCILHFGLTIIHPNFRENKIMYGINHKPVIQYLLEQHCKPVYITNVTMQPTILGSFADNLSQAFPHYKTGYGKRPCPLYIEIAETFVRDHGHEFGKWEHASLDKEHFIIKGSSLGACKELLVNYDNAAKYRTQECNDFCAHHLDYSNGDEVIQVGKLDVAVLFRSSWWMIERFGKKVFRSLRERE